MAHEFYRDSLKMNGGSSSSISYCDQLAQNSRSPRVSEGGGPAEKCEALLLPLEVSRRIFSQLDYRDLVQCSLVCKQWRLESAELRQGWKEEVYWEACCVRGVYISMDNAHGIPPVGYYLPGSPD